MSNRDNIPENFQQENPLKRRSGNPSSPPGSPPGPPPPPRKSERETERDTSSRPSARDSRGGGGGGRGARSSSRLAAVEMNSTTESEPVNFSKPIDSPPIPSTREPTKSTTSSRPTSTMSTSSDGSPDKSKPLQYGLWAHFMGYGSATLCFWFGITAVLWADAHFYDCRVNGQPINDIYILINGTCAAIYEGRAICCDPSEEAHIEGNVPLGALYIIYGMANLLLENRDWGYGAWFPKDGYFFKYRFSPLGILHILIGIIGFASYATAIAALCLFSTGIVYNVATYRCEAGDGGREQRYQERMKKTESTSCSYLLSFFPNFTEMKLNPIKFFRRIYREDQLSSYVWLGLYIALNMALFFYTLYAWDATAHGMRQGLIKGNLDFACGTPVCALARQVIKTGPVSRYAPWAKACGGCLNLNSAFILFPVTRLLLSKLNNIGSSYSRFQGGNANVFTRFLAHPITRYVPLTKNIEFHKTCAMAIFYFAWGHTIFHCLNLTRATATTLWVFRAFHWNGSDFFSGAVVVVAMFFIFSAAPDELRRVNFEIFFNNHHFFLVYYLFMFQHGPVFIYWTFFPVGLYLIEKYLQTKRGNHPFVVTKVEWIPPVMALQIKPINKEDFQFKEGQYLFLNCPFISKSEWHPFTISSAVDDLSNGTRVLLETGEEVMEAPRPSDWPADEKWSRYTAISGGKRRYEKSETGYNDYLSLHIKVHGLDAPKAKTWTRKLKEYFELMNPGDTAGGNGLTKGKFPFYFIRRDQRGDILIGRQFGPDGQPIIRVDGPHSAPAEHYTSYGTVMLIGAGIGLTPCMSILTALTRYRWKKNFTPEILHFYWVVRHNEIESFQWIVHALAENEHNLLKLRANGQVESKYYCEINIFVTAVPNGEVPHIPLLRPSSVGVAPSSVRPAFTADELYEGMLNPTISSKGMVSYMKSNPLAPNRFQDIWIWNGRPNWDEIFREVRENRQHADVGVCFCGAPVIGADLKTMCDKYSSVDDDILFSLHKENF